MTVDDFINWAVYACVNVEIIVQTEVGPNGCAINRRYAIEASHNITDHTINVGGSDLNGCMMMVVQYMHKATGATATIPVPK